MRAIKYNQILLGFIGISGAFCVLLGAWLAHASEFLDSTSYDRLVSAHHYHVIHTLALLALLLFSLKNSINPFCYTMWSFVCGIMLFSGSLYFKTYFEVMSIDITFVNKLAPWGGILLALGWLDLVRVAIFSRKILNKKEI